MLDPISAEQTARDSVIGLVTRRDLITVSGPDAAEYLHGQLSQNVTGLDLGATAWTLLLQPQGKVDAWLRLHRAGAETFLLDLEVGFGAAAVDRLKRFMLRVAVTIEVAQVDMLALRGPEAGAMAQHLAPDVIALDATWGGLSGVDLLAADPSVGSNGADASPAVSVWLSTEVPLGPPELLETLRVAQGRPSMGRELDESTIPAAAGVVDRSVDFTKGCYVGQELVARVDSRGNNTPTRLHLLRFSSRGEGELPPAGVELTVDGTPAGTVTSVAYSSVDGGLGLGYLKRSVALPADLSVAAADGRLITVVASELPEP